MSYISREGAQRTKRVVEAIESKHVNGPLKSPGASLATGVCLVHAKTDGSGIAAATSATQMTSGTVNIWIPSITGALVDSEITAVCWNKETSGAVSADTHILMALGPCGYVCLWEIGACT